MRFRERVERLPYLGLGVSTEYGAGDAEAALDVQVLRERHPAYAAFLEVGVEAARGLDRHARGWIGRGLPVTYHFLDVNLDEPEDFDDEWLDQVHALTAEMRPAWLCGDAGMWHVGRRERGHMLLLPPVLTAAAAAAMADGVCRLREATGYEVLPENPPGQVFLGELHALDFFALVADAADTGLVLDCAHLAMFQRLRGLPALAAFDGFPMERVVEIHVAGGTPKRHGTFDWIEDDHGPGILDDTWRIAEHVVRSASNLRAVVHECERNPLAAVEPGFERLAALVGAGNDGRSPAARRRSA